MSFNTLCEFWFKLKTEITYQFKLLIIWNLVLKVLIASGAGGGTAKKSIGKYFHLKEFGEKSYSIICNKENVEKTFYYFSTRYYDGENFNRKFDSLQLSEKRGNDSDKKYVENAIKNDGNEVNKLASLFIIIYRFRNNLFHGNKFPIRLNTYEKPFKVINKFLALYIEEMKFNIRIDEVGKIVNKDGIEIEG